MSSQLHFENFAKSRCAQRLAKLCIFAFLFILYLCAAKNAMAAPVVTSISPTTVVAGQQVTITGSNFGTTQGYVAFGSIWQGAITSWSNTQVVAAVPGSAQSGAVSVITSGLAQSNSVTLTVVPPNITSISPTTVLAGQSVTITGTHFGSTQYDVAFGSVWQGGITSWSDTQIVVPVPLGAQSGAVSVITSGNAHSNSVALTVLYPTITSISPTTAAVGQQVTITGSNFGSTQHDVSFGNTWQGGMTSWTDTQIVVPVPPNAQSGAVIVITSSGAHSNSLNLTVGNSAVASLSPSSLAFASQAVGATSVVQTVTLNNSGNAALTLTSIALAGTNPGDFAQTNNCGSNVAVGANCTISVTFKPTASGSRTAAVTLTDNATGSPQTVSLTGTGAVAAPVITSGTLASGTVGSAFSYQIAATNAPSSYGATGLPAGLTVSSTTGLISGTPAAAGTSTITLSATNSGGSGNATLTLTINLAPPVITSATTASGTVGSAFSYQITATNMPSSYGAAGLPAGLTVSSGTGLISGTPTAAGASTITLSATNSGGSGNATLTLTINLAPPVITSATTASGTIGSAFSYQIAATNAPSSYGATGLPSGLTVNSATGLISGTPTAAGTSTITLSATNSGGSGNATLTLTINLAPPVITSATTASGTVGSAFSYQIAATNAPSSYGATGLPTGLALNSGTGLISGTPTAAGTSTVTLSATNAVGSGTATLTLTITLAAPVITSSTMASVRVGSAVAYQIAATGMPTSYAATGLPAGLSVNSTTGLISGTPTATGTSTVTLSATNAVGSGTATLTLAITAPAPALLAQTVANQVFGTSTISLAFPANTLPGDLLLVAGDFGASVTLVSVTDSQGNNYAPIGTPVSSSAGVATVLYYARNTKGGADTVTITLSAPPIGIEAYLTEYSGLNPTNPLDAQAGASGSTSPASANVTTTAAGDLIYAHCYGNASAVGSGFTALSIFGGTISENESVGNPGAYAATATTNGGWTMQMVALRTAASPVITSATTAIGTLGSAFSYQITATNSPTSYGATGLPAGLSVNSATGLISGTPTSTGTSSVTLSATSSGGTGTATLTLTIGFPPPMITSAATANGTVGSAFSYPITATNSPTSYGATGLPAGLAVNSATGLISGTPTAPGTSTVTLSATNSGGTGSAAVTLTITLAPPVITSSTTASGTVGSAFSYQITATNTPSSYAATGLPAGLTVNSATGLISGTPTAAGTSTVTLSATNSGGTGNATLTLTINLAPPVITSATTASGTTGSAFSYQIAATNAPNSYGATGLPAGLTVSSGTGLISGTPTAAAISTITLSATNAGGTANATLTLTINLAPPVITSATTASGTVGTAFSYQITATNSPTLYAVNGLPAGLALNSNTGLISGSPTAAGTFTVTLGATNSGGAGFATLTLTIAATAPAITSATTASGTVGTAFSYQITATNSPTSYGAAGLPAGLTVNSGTGLISGRPTAAGASTVTLSATNAGGTGSATLTLTIAATAPAITSATTASGTVGTAFSYQITATNSPTSYGAAGLPAGLTVNSGTGLISGTPTAAGTSTVTLSATNAGGTGSATLTLTIAATAPVITSATTASGTVGSAFSYQITATNSPTHYAVNGLSAGLALNSNTGLISGSPTAAGTFTVTLGATNSGGAGFATLTLTIAATAPAITSATTASGTVGTAFSYQITATNSPTSYGAAGLPTGLTMNSGTGLISGTPTAAGTSTVTLSATNSGGTGNATLAITINAGSPIASVSPSNLTFASQIVGSTSAAQSIALNNTGNAALTISSIALTGANPGDFAQTNTCGSGVAAGGNCTISVTFKPAASGARTAAITITDNAIGSPQTVSLSGTGSSTGTTANLSPSSQTFGNCPVAMNCSTQTITLNNTGSTALSISSIAMTGANPSDFVQNNTCGSSLSAGGSCNIVIMFTPSATGSRTASLSITDNASGSPQSAALSGTGAHDVVLTWTASPTPGIEGYNVYRGTSSGGEGSTPINSMPINSTTFADANVAAGSKYYYVVTAVASDGSSQSGNSNEASATVPSP